MLLTTTAVLSAAALQLVAAQDLSWVPYNRANFDHFEVLAPDVVLHWKLSPNGDDSKTRFGIAARTNGYLSLGFSEVGGMKGAQIATGRKVGNEFNMTAMKAAGFVKPDTLQWSDIEFIEGSSNNGVVGFTFNKTNSVPCISVLNDVHLDGQMFIWAKGSNDDFSYHGNAGTSRGSKLVNLRANALQFRSAVGYNFTNAQKWEVRSPNLTVATEETSYCYSLHRVPTGNARWHLIGDLPHVDTNLVHHLVILGCNGLPFTAQETSQLQTSAQCNFSFRRCENYIAEWAPGNQGRLFPDTMGLPLGSGFNAEWVLLEIHYNNPGRTAGTIDSSGLDLYLTNTLRSVEVGTLTSGDLQAGAGLWTVPANSGNYTYESTCPGECTSAGLSQEITVMGGVYHMHTKGSEMDMSIVRDGVEVTRIRRLKDFDFNYQPFSPLNFTIRPGDKLITRCTFNTTGDTNPTRAGIGSNEEMCMFFMAYYPRQELSLCSKAVRDTGSGATANDTICLRSSSTNQWLGNLTIPWDAQYTKLPNRVDNCTLPLTGGSEGKPEWLGAFAMVATLIAVVL